MEKGRRIFSVQDDLDTLKVALDKVKDTKENILITNCICRLRLGGTRFHTIFDTALYNDDNNMLILLKENIGITQEEFREILDKNNTIYNEVAFRDYIRFTKPETEKEMFFATNSSNFAKAIEKSQEKGIDSCTYYPAVSGRLTVKYFYDKALQEQLDSYLIRGVIELDDKYILVVINKDEHDLRYSKILSILEKKNMNIDIDYSYEIDEKTTEKRLVKKHEEREDI